MAHPLLIYRALREVIINLRACIGWIWRNDEFIGSQDIVFESTTENTGDKSGGLMPCFNQVLLERIGLNSSAFPELAQQQNNKCINLLKAVPDATINFDFAAMRLNITIPQIALLSSAHGVMTPTY